MAGEPLPLLVSRMEAARLLAMSVDHFEAHVQPAIKVVRSGSRVLIPRVELERFVREGSARALRRW